MDQVEAAAVAIDADAVEDEVAGISADEMSDSGVKGGVVELVKENGIARC